MKDAHTPGWQVVNEASKGDLPKLIDQYYSENITGGIDSTLLILPDRLKGKAGSPTIETIKDYGDVPKVGCYPGQLNQVFMNLLANGIDALEYAIKNEVMAQR